MYIECPHCNAIFALPAGTDHTDHEKKMRCGECSTVFVISDHFTTNTQGTSAQSSHFNFDHMFAGESLEDTPSNPEDMDDDKTYHSLDDTIELYAEPFADIESNELFDEETAHNNQPESLPSGSDNNSSLDAVFEDYIKKNQKSIPGQPEGITSKTSGDKLDDREDLLPEINIDLDEYTTIDNASNDLYEQMKPAGNQLGNSSSGIDLPGSEKHSNDIYAEKPEPVDESTSTDTPGKYSSSHTWIELPTLDNLQLIKEEDLEHISHGKNAPNDSVQRNIPVTEPVDENPVFAFDEDEHQSQESLDLAIQENLLGENFIDISETDSFIDNTDIETAIHEPGFTPADTLLAIKREDFFAAEEKFSRPDIDRRKVALYSGIGLLLLLLLGGQYVYNNRLELASSTVTKPLVSVICKVAGCEVKIKRSPDLITTLDKSIYNLPGANNVLVIKATIRNSGAQPQPYPIVEILFSDINENSLAMRRFGPAEYLQNIPEYEILMAPEEPVYLELEVADPGRDATSFRFNYL